ncbi:MFS transporter [Actinoplanes italicus]|uniref:NNP family nitrate/nitrite transporter-like MFS transporter n=1 Tax=Actinoplanes italicus TaxID=113567 RepID=A0A2T0K373_9ACTN|nr:MFS transporter [Actinoplanes italicus]PRX17063.1 NNP family nitrate/nitrite transporter-like MFS transporter [Actinoplanes italicus]GIE36194.1 MFS transporter [Actinoplanes italicus]
MAPLPRANAPALVGNRAMLALAVTGYLLTSWAWTLLGPLAPALRGTLGLTAMQQAFVVAVPVVVGALGRIPAGALTDRLGGRRVQLLILAVTVLALLELAAAGHRSFPGLLLGAVLLGAAGAMFAASVGFVGGWFPQPRRGLAFGVLGLGLCGGALGGATGVRLAAAYGLPAPFLVTALAVGAFGLVALATLHDAPRAATDHIRPEVSVADVLRLPITGQAAAWYAINFAVFVTFTSFLPVYLTGTYAMAPARTGDVMAAFMLFAVLMRPVGGWLADRFSPARPLVAALALVALATAVQATSPPVPVLLAGTLPVLAVGVGVASTAVLARIGQVAPPGTVGLITGVAGATGGMAGFLSPLIMAYTRESLGSYGPALGALAVGAAAAAVHAVIKIGQWR